MAEFPSAIGVGATLSSNSKPNDSLDRQGLQTITMFTETAFEVLSVAPFIPCGHGSAKAMVSRLSHVEEFRNAQSC